MGAVLAVVRDGAADVWGCRCLCGVSSSAASVFLSTSPQLLTRRATGVLWDISCTRALARAAKLTECRTLWRTTTADRPHDAQPSTTEGHSEDETTLSRRASPIRALCGVGSVVDVTDVALRRVV